METSKTIITSIFRFFIMIKNLHFLLLAVVALATMALSTGRREQISGPVLVKGDEFHDVEVRGEDSIFVFVESRLDPTNQDNPEYLEDNIEFITNGVAQKVAITAWGQDVVILNDTTLTKPTHLTSNKPYVVYGTLTVDSLIDVTIDPGATLLFHDKASLLVKGKLTACGTQEKPITMRGDRLDHVVGEIGYDIMSGQWDGVYFNHGSYDNELSYVLMRGNTYGMQVYSSDMNRRSLHLFNCVLHNASFLTLLGYGAWIDAEGCEFSDAGIYVADFFGIASSNKMADKFERTGLHAVKSSKVDAPIIEEYPLTMECRVVEFQEQPYGLRVLGEIVDVIAEESVLDEKGRVDAGKLNAFAFDQMRNNYYAIGDVIGKAWNAGAGLMKKE